MAISSKILGSGITGETIRLTAVRDLTDGDLDALRRALFEMPDRLNQPWGTKAPMIAALRKELVKIKADAPPLEDYAASAAYFATHQTKAWFILNCVKLANHVERCVEEGRPWEAVSFAFDIGKLISELSFKTDWEQQALAGQKLLESQGKGARARRKRSPEERYQAVLPLLEKGLSLNRSVQLAGNRLGDSPSTVMRDYYIIKKRSKPDRLE